MDRLGDQPFDDKNSPRDNFITALLTLGEGYHNFHHEVSMVLEGCQITVTDYGAVPLRLSQRSVLVSVRPNQMVYCDVEMARFGLRFGTLCSEEPTAVQHVEEILLFPDIPHSLLTLVSEIDFTNHSLRAENIPK